jgi:acyl-[acyl-carrier-protein]-phospholipid O-acyltransferase/long-chain-fatty-acid--[acyl-carrier-protein] ligase
VVASVPDARKGERLVVLYTELKNQPDALCRKLGDEGLSPLWIPSTDSFRQVDEIPMLGTGKLDLKSLQSKALELFTIAVD